MPRRYHAIQWPDNMSDNAKAADLSVIVTVIDGVESLTRCLDALAGQEGGLRLEVIIPFDNTIPAIGALAVQYPEFIFLNLGVLADRPPRNAFDEHTFLDRRRAGGLGAATADLLAMIEDRGWPRPDWAQAMIDLHQVNPHPAIGGAVFNAAPTPMLNAVFKCDYGRSEPPTETSEREYLTDINICYKRAALMKISDLWCEEYHEVTVNDALKRNGGKLLFSSAPVVCMQRRPRAVMELLKERFYWGRIVARIRADSLPRAAGLKFAVLTPALPFVLSYRIFRLHGQKGRSFKLFLKELPPLFLLLTFWSMGECSGYIEASFLRPSGDNPKI